MPDDPRATGAHAATGIEAVDLRDLVEQLPEAVAILSTDNRVLRVSNDFTRMFGYAADEVLGNSLEELIVPATQVESAADYVRRLRRGERLEVETIRRRKDGTEVQVSLLAVPVTAAGGAHVANYAIFRDITERKRAEEQLLESEARFRAIADTAPVMIWTTGTDGLCNYFSKPWLDFTGRTMQEEVGVGWTQGVHPDDLQGCFDNYWPEFHARKPFRMDYRLRRADGEYRWVIESGVPRYTGAGEFAGYIGSNIDVTDIKHAEEEREKLRRLQSELSRMDRLATMGELAASLAHELNQPIAGIAASASACTRWLSREAPDTIKASDAAARIAHDVVRAASIMDRLRSLYMRGSTRREQVDLNDMIREMNVVLHETAHRSSVSIRTDLEMALPATTADRVQLQQVLMNLMLNAIEAMKDTGGELTVTSKSTDDDQLLISVSDAGIGLPAEDVERIFEAFFTTKPQGTGMGLALSRRIIESHGGRLWASRNTGRGATFQFSLPRDMSSDAC